MRFIINPFSSHAWKLIIFTPVTYFIVIHYLKITKLCYSWLQSTTASLIIIISNLFASRRESHTGLAVVRFSVFNRTVSNNTSCPPCFCKACIKTTLLLFFISIRVLPTLIFRYYTTCYFLFTGLIILWHYN